MRGEGEEGGGRVGRDRKKTYGHYSISSQDLHGYYTQLHDRAAYDRE
jgi:hypothetical protein